jgi:hypothetical protein
MGFYFIFVRNRLFSWKYISGELLQKYPDLLAIKVAIDIILKKYATND